jgi:hypothetical protein
LISTSAVPLFEVWTVALTGYDWSVSVRLCVRQREAYLYRLHLLTTEAR